MSAYFHFTFTDAEVEEIIAWGTPEAALTKDGDEGLIIHGQFHLTSGLKCPVFGTPTPYRGVDVWSKDALIRWDWVPPEIFQGYDENGTRTRIDPQYASAPWSKVRCLTDSIRSFLGAMRGEGHPGITGHDLRQALEIAIAAKLSARLGSVPVRLPLADRLLSLFPSPYRWLGGDATGRPQSLKEAAGR